MLNAASNGSFFLGPIPLKRPQEPRSMGQVV
jgi:hypothetical protein